jgi:glycosyltransferase involved in cell wall biosynthesis
VEKAAVSLSEAGYLVKILGWDRTATRRSNTNIGSIELTRLKIKAGYGKGIKNFPGLIRWQVGCILWLTRHHADYEIIHACDFDTVIPALFTKFIWGKIVVYDIFDFYADHLRSTPSWITNVIRWADKRIIGIVDGVILADDSRKEQISGSRPKRIVVVYNTPIDYQNKQHNFVETQEDKDFTLAYIGLLQVERGIFEILEIMKHHSDWRFLLAGFGGDEKLIMDRASVLDNVTWYGRVSYDQALRISREADILLATYNPSIPNHRYASPNKVFEAMMLGKPIIVANGTNIDRIIEDHEFGFVVDYGDTDGIDRVLTRLAEAPRLKSNLGRNARLAYERHYSWSEMESRLLMLYNDLKA